MNNGLSKILRVFCVDHIKIAPRKWVVTAMIAQPRKSLPTSKTAFSSPERIAWVAAPDDFKVPNLLSMIKACATRQKLHKDSQCLRR
mmetsp:Transcript_1247/g.1770  ORF Transcript_1247/g.1770 Transcript_1247/m.1770 type:complete len:87 (+) Transcript_1247:32-292(+)